MTEKGVDFESINYTDTPLSVNGLRDLLHRAALTPKEVLRTNEVAYREHVAGKNLSGEELLQIMAKHPELLQRPIVVNGNKAVLARPIERLKHLGLK